MHHTKVRHLGVMKDLVLCLSTSQGCPYRGVPPFHRGNSRKCVKAYLYIQRSHEAVLFLDRVWIYHGKLSRDKAIIYYTQVGNIYTALLVRMG